MAERSQGDDPLPNVDERVMEARDMVHDTAETADAGRPAGAFVVPVDDDRIAMDDATTTYEVMEPVPILEGKPAFELIDGYLEQKMRPTRRHQALEERWVAALTAWAGNAGEAHAEWRHQFTPPGFRFGSLVPDIAYDTRAALHEMGPSAAEAPPRAPHIAVEILSKGESEDSVMWKVHAYLAGGTRVVFVVDPPKRTAIAYDRRHVAIGQLNATRFGPSDVVSHPLMPRFAFPVDAMFEGLYLGD